MSQKLYRCTYDNKILTEKALSKGVCAGHTLVPHEPDEDHKVYQVAVSVPSESLIKCDAYDNHMINIFRLGGLQERWRYERRNPRYEFAFFTAGRMITPMAREKLTTTALDHGMDYMIMYDDDMLIPYDAFPKLLEDMEAHPEIDILAPLAFMRSAPHYAVIYTTKEGYDPVRHTDYYINHWVKNYPKDRLVECDAVGFGMVVIRMEMVKRMQKPYFFSMSATGEDILFCVNARKQAKARVFVDTRIKLGHLGESIIIDEAYREKYVKEHNEKLVNVAYKYPIEEIDPAEKFNSLDR